ncbi:MAG: ATP-binding cassette domain-containing protein, partial [Turicibacter sp.]|nr:ATP-binding cassette domain-containing protein [Turicibacter sp.]
MIKLHQIKKIFKTKSGEVSAVNSVDLSIGRGEIFGIIGYSGAGKSTLIRMINLLEQPTEGSIKIEGKDLTKLSPKELRLARQQIGMVFQPFNLLWSRT